MNLDSVEERLILQNPSCFKFSGRQTQGEVAEVERRGRVQWLPLWRVEMNRGKRSRTGGACSANSEARIPVSLLFILMLVG